MRYLTGCADFFRRSITDIAQFTLVKGKYWRWRRDLNPRTVFRLGRRDGAVDR